MKKMMKNQKVLEQESVAELPNFDSPEKKQDNTGFTMGQLSSDSSADSSMEGGEKVNLSNVSLSGQKNYFLNRLKKRQPKIFSTKKSEILKIFSQVVLGSIKSFLLLLIRKKNNI